VRRSAINRQWLAHWGLPFLLACGGDEPPQPPTLPGTLPAPCELQTTTCVIRELTFPPTPLDSLDYGLDVDGAPAAFSDVDNNLGSFAGRMNLSFGFEFTAHANIVLAGGEWRMELGTCAEEPEFLRVRVLGADPDAALVPAEGTRVRDRLEARLGFGLVPLGALLDLSTTEIDARAWYEAVAVAIRATSGGETVEGIVAGAFPAAVRGEVLDEYVLSSFNLLLASDPGCPEDCQTTTGRALTDRLDDDKDGTISLAEFATDVVRTSELLPDVDLTATFEGEPTFWPNWDGEDDHFSFGLRFHADSCLPSS
jgi:hypothetical protein